MPEQTPTSEFDVATAVSADGTDRFRAAIDPGFTIGPKAHGGYLLAVVGRAAGAAMRERGSDHTDVLAITSHFVASPDPGPATIDIEVLRQGRSASQVRTTLRQDGAVAVEATCTLGDLSSVPDQAWWSDVPPPDLPPIEDCVRMVPIRDDAAEGSPRVSIADHLDSRLDPATAGFIRAAPSGRGDLRGWLSLADGRPVDSLALLFLLDALPPASFDLVAAGWIPTLSLTAYLHRLPEPGPLKARQYIRIVHGNRLSEVCEIWDGSGHLVGEATQLAGIRVPAGAVPPERTDRGGSRLP